MSAARSGDFSVRAGYPGFRFAHPGYGLFAQRYFSEELTAVNLVPSCGPMPCTTAMIAKAMPQAIRQYSIAVAPDSSAKNFAITTASRRRIRILPRRCPRQRLGPIGCQQVDQHAEQSIKTGAET